MVEREPWAEKLRSTRRLRGWSQRNLATRIAPAARALGVKRIIPTAEIMVVQIKRWERGGALPDADYQYILASCFGLTVRELFGDKARIDVPLGRIVATGGKLEIPFFARAEDDEMHRRKFAGWLMMLSAGAVALPEPIRHMLTAPDQPQLLPAITMTDVKRLHTTFGTLMGLEHEVGGAVVRRASLAQTQWALEQLDHKVPGSVEARDAWKIMTARLANIAGGSSQDSGRDQQARALRVLAFQVASTVEEDPNADAHRMFSLVRLARQTIELDRPRTALSILNTAQSLAPDATPTSWSHLHAVRARAYAATGDRQRMLRELGAAERHFSEVSLDDLDREPWLRVYQSVGQYHYDVGTAHYLLHRRGGALPPNEAGEIRQSFMDCTAYWGDDELRTKTSARLRAATTMLRAREPDDAVALAIPALPALPTLHSSRLTEDVRDLRRAAMRYKNPDVTNLLDELRTMD